MPITLPDGTQVKQRQVDTSVSVNDNLSVPNLSYSKQKSLEYDLNYLRSILKQVKGTDKYDSPLIKSLEILRLELEEAVFTDATLLGESTAEAPNLGDYSDRIATTAFVTDTINQLMVVGGSDVRYVHTQNSAASVWYINHDLGKFPSVSVADSSGELVMGSIMYNNSNSLEVHFESAFSGKAYLN